MQRIRIKKAPNKGDQRDYSLYDRTSLNPGAPDNTERIGNTMGPIDRKDANVEVERGEVVIGDTNQDGFLELFTFTGKPHSQGGTPVNIPPGSFIYSNTPKLRIKDAELLKSQFGLSMKKGGWTPAEIANKFQINEYVSDLKNPDTDNLTKRSADRMLKNNLDKLGVLALIQESMKGFPDGVPAIAENAIKELGVDPSIITGQQAQPQPEQQEAPQQEAQEQPQEAPEQEAAESQGMPSPEEMQMMQQQGMQKYGGLTQFGDGGMNVNQANALTNTLMQQYHAAYKRKDYNALAQLVPQLQQAAKQINEFNNAGWWSMGMVPGSDQYNFNSDVAALNEAANYVTNTIIPQNTIVADLNTRLGQLTSKYDAAYNKLMTGQLTNLTSEELDAIKNIYDIKKQFAAHAANINSGGSGMPVSELTKLQKRLDKYSAASSSGDNGMSTALGAEKPLYTANSNSTSNTTKTSAFKKGDIYKTKYGQYEVVSDPTSGSAVQLRNKATGADTSVVYEDMLNHINSKRDASIIPGSAPVQNTNTTNTSNNTTTTTTTNNTPVQVTPKPRVSTAPKPNVTTTPGTTNVPSSSLPSSGTSGPMFSDDIYKLRFGGYLKHFSLAGTVTGDDVANAPVNQTAAAPEQEQFVSDITVNGKTYKKYKQGDNVIIKDTNGTKLSVKNTKTGEKTDYTPDAIITYNAKNERINIDVPDPSTNWKATPWKGKYTESAIQFEKLINDPNNQKLRDAIYDQFLKIAQDYAARTGDKSLLNISKENALQLLIKGNTDNALINSVYNDSPLLKSSDWDKTQANDYVDANGKKISGKNLFYNKVASKLGITPMDELGTRAFQAIYHASQDVARKPEFVEQFNKSGFDITPIGINDQTRGNLPISPVDDIYGNTTVGQMYKLKDQPPPPPPGKKAKYYCVKQQDGTSSIVTVTYDEGTQPTAPAGAVAGFDDYSTASASCSKEQPGLEHAPRKSGPWWLPDIVNYTGTMTDRINRYEPVLEQINSQTPGYVLLDPTRQLAANQSQMQQYNDMLQNSMSGNLAAATSLGASGEAFNNAANVLGTVENQNVGIVNNMSAGNAQIKNQQDMLNAQARQNYVGQMATLNQNIDNAEKERKWRQIAAFNNGTNNWYRKKQMEQVLFPQVYIDPIMGDAEFSGKGRDLFGYDTYSPAYATPTKSNAGVDVQAIYNKHLQNNTPEMAKWLTQQEIAATRTSDVATMNAQQQYLQSVMNQVGQQRWGGAITPWDFDS